MSSKNTGVFKIKARIMAGETIAFGPGKADLLDAIISEGSISGAARKLGMSYRRAWMLVDTMNGAWELPLVTTLAGNHKGAQLTEWGRIVLGRYRAVEHALDEAATKAAGGDLLSRLAAKHR